MSNLTLNCKYKQNCNPSPKPNQKSTYINVLTGFSSPKNLRGHLVLIKIEVQEHKNAPQTPTDAHLYKDTYYISQGKSILLCC